MAEVVLNIMGRKVAVEVPDSEPVTSSEDSAWQANVQGGWGQQADAELQEAAEEMAEANRVATMPLSQFARERDRLGPGRVNRGMFD